MTRIGLLGGTFDPPHLGHLVAAEAALDVLGLDEVRWLVAGRPWMKGGETAPHHRIAMVEAAVAGNAAMSVDDREAHRDGPTYTADTLAELTDEQPHVQWTFLLGADAAASLPAWDRIDEGIDLATWAVVARPGVDWPTHELADRLQRVEMPLIGISSTDLRARAADGQSLRYLVPDPVLDHIVEHQLYRSADA